MGKHKSNEVRQIVIDSFKQAINILEIIGGSVSKRTVNEWIQVFRESGKMKQSFSTGRPPTANNHIIKKKVKRLLNSYSGRQISKKLDLSLRSVVNIRKDLNLKAYKKRKVPLLKPDHIKKRYRFAQWWRKNKKIEFKNHPFMFSIEKIFTVDGGLNKQNHRVYAYSREEADKKGGFYGVMKNPLSVMVWIGLTENGATEPYFVEK
ncbi:1 transposase, partial [Brachionus plicatilis]